MKVLAFDLELDKPVNLGEDEDFWKVHAEQKRLTGQSWEVGCAGLLIQDHNGRLVRPWYGLDPLGNIAPYIPHDDLVRLLHVIKDHVKMGFPVITWNGVGFDWPMLADLTGEHLLVKRLALASYDPCYQHLIEHGYPIKLQSVAEGFDLAGKTMSGADAPILWQMGEVDEVLNYVQQDVVVLTEVVEQSFKYKGFKRRTNSGGWGYTPYLNKGLLTVRQLLQMPEAKHPEDEHYIPRREYDKWLTTA